MKIQVEVLMCSSHKFICLGVNDRRVVGNKCCGNWDETIAKWSVDATELRKEIATALKGIKNTKK